MPPNFPKRPPMPVDLNPPPPEWIRPQPRAMSEAAARAAQHVDDLEAQVSALTSERNQLKNMLELSEERNTVLTSRLTSVELDRDYHQQRSIEIQTKLTIVGAIILDVMKESNPAEVAQARSKSADLIAQAAEAALTTETLHGDDPQRRRDNGQAEDNPHEDLRQRLHPGTDERSDR